MPRNPQNPRKNKDKNKKKYLLVRTKPKPFVAAASAVDNALALGFNPASAGMSAKAAHKTECLTVVLRFELRIRAKH